MATIPPSRLSVLLHLALIMGCAEQPPPQTTETAAPGVRPLGGISADGPLDFHPRVTTSHIERSPFHAVLRIANSSDSAVKLEYTPCSFMLRAYRSRPIDGRPNWDGQRAFPCPDVMINIVIYPHGYREIELFTAMAILGDSLAAGEYTFSLAFWHQGEPSRVYEIPAGSAVVRR